jgi:predicted RNase H-like nuclease (RuvC/YqgF family)
MFDMYRQKPKKKPVDPNAPPRPNLLNHEKRLKSATATVESQAQEISDLKRKVESLEAKMANQTAYLGQLHHAITQLKRG